MQGTRALLALVIVMGVLILAGTAGLVAVVVHRLAHPTTTAGPTGLAAMPGSGPVPGQAGADAAIGAEPAGTRITALVRQSDTVLSIALTGGGPDRVLVWDLAGRRALTEIRMAP